MMMTWYSGVYCGGYTVVGWKSSGEEKEVLYMQRVIWWQPECETKRRKALPYTSGHLSTCIPLQDDEESCSLQVPPRGRAVQHGGYVVHHTIYMHIKGVPISLAGCHQVLQLR